jgi:hypothetical protein
MIHGFIHILTMGIGIAIIPITGKRRSVRTDARLNQKKQTLSKML